MPLHHPPTEAELTALAHRLAYSTARSDIECYTTPRHYAVGTRPIYDLTTADEDYVDEIALAERYLDARGLLVVYAGFPGRCVSILDETPDVSAEAGRVLDVRLGAPA